MTLWSVLNIIDFFLFFSNNKPTPLQFRGNISSYFLHDIYSCFPGEILESTRLSTIQFVQSLIRLKRFTPINPYTQRHTILFAITSCAIFNLTMNFFCSLSHLSFDPKSLLFIFFDKPSYNYFSKYPYHSIYYPLTQYINDGASLCVTRLVIVHILLTLNYEVLHSDIDIFYFRPFNEYLFLKEAFDIGYCLESDKQTLAVSSLRPYPVNGGFFKYFPTKSALNFLQFFFRHPDMSIFDQVRITHMIKYFSKCNKTLRPGFYNCRLNNFTFRWRIFIHDMINSCIIVKKYSDINLLNLSRTFQPKMFHLICMSGENVKLQFLNYTGLSFFDSQRLKCIASKAINKWEMYYNYSIPEILDRPFSRDHFPPLNVSNDCSQLPVVNDILNFGKKLTTAINYHLDLQT